MWCPLQRALLAQGGMEPLASPPGTAGAAALEEPPSKKSPAATAAVRPAFTRDGGVEAEADMLRAWRQRRQLAGDGAPGGDSRAQVRWDTHH